PRTEVRFAGMSGELVPRAYQLAVVAAEYPVAHRGAQLLGNGALELDGQVGDAAPRIQDIGADKGIGGAAAQAGAATAAVVAGEGFVHRQRQVGVQLAEKEIAAGLRVDQHAVLADPAEPGAAGKGPLQHRGTVTEGAVAERADRRPDLLRQTVHSPAAPLVMIPAKPAA